MSSAADNRKKPDRGEPLLLFDVCAQHSSFADSTPPATDTRGTDTPRGCPSTSRPGLHSAAFLLLLLRLLPSLDVTARLAEHCFLALALAPVPRCGRLRCLQGPFRHQAHFVCITLGPQDTARCELVGNSG